MFPLQENHHLLIWWWEVVKLIIFPWQIYGKTEDLSPNSHAPSALKDSYQNIKIIFKKASKLHTFQQMLYSYTSYSPSSNQMCVLVI